MSDLLKKLRLNLTDIKKLEKEVPANGIIPEEDALKLMVKFSTLAAKLSDMIIKARRYEQDIRMRRDNLLIDLKSKSQAKSEIGKEREAMQDDSWRTLQRERKEVQSLREWLELKREDAVRAHLMCKIVLNQIATDRVQTPKVEV